jgi:hypothetical protein
MRNDHVKRVSTSRGALLLVGAVLLAPPARAGAAKSAAPPSFSAVACDDLRVRWGIEVVRLFLTSYGHMVDFRYRVIDPVKARPIFDAATPAHLRDEKSGRLLAVPDGPKTGRIRNTGVPEPGRVYFILFQNQGGLIEKGDLVSVVVGDFVASDVTVE